MGNEGKPGFENQREGSLKIGLVRRENGGSGQTKASPSELSAKLFQLLLLLVKFL